MILIGQFDSPFVRRVGIALEHYGLPYQHRPWSVFGDADKLAEVNPLIRVPTLVLDDGDVLAETFVILDALDDMAPQDRRLIAASGAARRHVMRIAGLAHGACDKLVSMVYENRIHQRATEAWMQRLRKQISGALDALETEQAKAAGPWLLGASLSHADIAMAATWRFLSETFAKDFDTARWPRLAQLSLACEASPMFRQIYQPYVYIPPKTA